MSCVRVKRQWTSDVTHFLKVDNEVLSGERGGRGG